MKLILLVLSLMLVGCKQDISDLQLFVDEVRTSVQPLPLPVPKIRAFQHQEYRVEQQRSPFQPPQPELLAATTNFNQHCQKPDASRAKYPLEQFSLENLKMRGTLEGKSGLWALVEASNTNLYRTRVGEYMGLFNGKITSIQRRLIEITELLPDGTGCWQPRSTQLSLKIGNE
jgi:type IV pilus assembly protein PilP